jgi:peroxiredoxin
MTMKNSLRHDVQRRHAGRRVVLGALALALTPLAGTVALAAVPATAAPDFTLPTTLGPNLRLQEQRGKVVLVNFWATWCGPCKQEMPELNKLYDKYRASGFVLLGVNVDDNARHASEVAAKLGLRFPVLLDTDKTVSRLYELSTMPTTVLIDRDGRVRHVHSGYLAGYEQLYDKEIRGLLK